MYSKGFAEIYVDFYQSGRGKSYAAEAVELADMVRQRKPDAASLLDVACGSGEHLNGFDELFDHAEGIDYSKTMVDVARDKFPELKVAQGDMRDFSLGRRFDAITCMFSSIGHVRDRAELDATLECFARHLNPRGVVIVEPWWFTPDFLDGYVASDIVKVDDRTIMRLSHSALENGKSRVTVHFAVADPKAGLTQFTDSYLVSLFERAEYEDAFDRAGITPEFLEGGPLGRGLLVGILR